MLLAIGTILERRSNLVVKDNLSIVKKVFKKVFISLKLSSGFPPQSTVSKKSDLSSKVESSYHHKLQTWLCLEKMVVSLG